MFKANIKTLYNIQANLFSGIQLQKYFVHILQHFRTDSAALKEMFA